MIITLHTIQDRALVFAARIHISASQETRDALANYGECLRKGAKPGALTLVRFVNAMTFCQTAEYQEFTECLLENEIVILNNSIARAVAILENETRKAQR